MNNNKMIIFSAPSGAGKTTIVREIIKEEKFQLEFSVSACSRSKRENEEHGKDYYFLSIEEFKQKIDNNEFVEWEEVYKNQYYGTFITEIERIWKKGKNVVFDVDVVGGLNIKKQYEKEALAIFIQPPSISELKKRLIARNTETDATLNKRLSKATTELEYSTKFDKVIVNDNLDVAVETIRNILNNYLVKMI